MKVDNLSVDRGGMCKLPSKDVFKNTGLHATARHQVKIPLDPEM